MSATKIAEVRLLRVEGRLPVEWHWSAERQAGLLSAYPELCRRPAKPKGKTFGHEAIYVEVTDSNGVVGRYGPIGAEQAFLIGRRLRPFLLGRDPAPIETLWDQMYRIDRHARTGYMLMAISAIDNALWDLKGRAAGLPVARLLAGEPRTEINAYCSINHYPDDPAAMAALARLVAREGYTAQKWFFRAGAGSGAAGADENLRMAQTVREALGDDGRIMFDCRMSWDDEFADRMAPELLKFRPLFVEECFPPHFFDSFARLRREHIELPLAAGEHLYTRWEVKPYVENGLLAAVQSDPDWCGGISELLVICDLASLYGVPVIPHGHSMAAAVQVVASRPDQLCPIAEFLPPHQNRQQYFHLNPIVPAGGVIAVPDAPGLGIELDESKLDAIERLTEWIRG